VEDTPAPPVRPGPGLGELVLACDLDRTLTGPDLVPDAMALAALAQLRRAGVACVLVTGRSFPAVSKHEALREAFDAIAVEGGAEWGTWDHRLGPGGKQVLFEAASRLEAEGIQVRRRNSSFSCSVEVLEAVRKSASGCSVNVNVDRVDVLPPGLDKGTGLDGALSTIGRRSAFTVAIGDGENDIPMFLRASLGVATGNATDALKEVADIVLDEPGPAAVIRLASDILLGRTPAADGGPGAPGPAHAA
jgi:hydroxymethylpyrimidine pyrophosphatase-like HAD family hydrolase